MTSVFSAFLQVLYLLQLVQALKYEDHQEILQDVDRSLGRHASDSSITLAIEPQLRQRKSADSGTGERGGAAASRKLSTTSQKSHKSRDRVASTKTRETSSLLASGGDMDDDDDEEEDEEEEGKEGNAGGEKLQAAPDMAMSMADAMAEFEDSNTLDEKTVSLEGGGGLGVEGTVVGLTGIPTALEFGESCSSSSSHLASSLHSGNLESRLQSNTNPASTRPSIWPPFSSSERVTTLSWRVTCTGKVLFDFLILFVGVLSCHVVI